MSDSRDIFRIVFRPIRCGAAIMEKLSRVRSVKIVYYLRANVRFVLFIFFYMFSYNNTRAVRVHVVVALIMRRTTPPPTPRGTGFSSAADQKRILCWCRSLYGRRQRRRRFSSPNRRFSYSVPTSYIYFILCYFDYYCIIIIVCVEAE